MFSQKTEDKSIKTKLLSPIEKLPSEIWRHQMTFLDTQDAKAFVSSGRLFSQYCRRDLHVAILLKCIARGEQDKALAMVSHHPGLLLSKGYVRDDAHRAFHDISPLQYAFWALDRHMWEMLLEYMPQDVAARQLAELEAKGTEHGVHYNFSVLTNALQDFVQQFEGASEADRHRLWCKGVGGAQISVPAHVAQEYCARSRMSFYIIPTFKELKLPRALEFYSGIKSNASSWFSDPCLGEQFAVMRAWFGCARSSSASNAYGAASQDLLAMTTLFKVRTEEMSLLKQRLLKEVPENKA